MGYAIVIGGLVLLYFGAKGQIVAGAAPAAAGAPQSVLGVLAGDVSRVLTGAVRGQVKLGNADPNFEPWLATETEKLLGPVSGSASFKAADHQGFADNVRARRLLTYDQQAGARRSGSSGSLSLASPQGVGKIAGLGVQGAEIGLNLTKTVGGLATAVPIIGSAIGIVTQVIGAFTAQHAAAVAREQNTLYSVEPSLNRALDQLDQAYRAGQISGAQMKSALEELYANFVSALSLIAQPAVFDPATTIATHHCNAGCTQERVLRGIIDAMVLFDY
jgi:hypothetical protein